MYITKVITVQLIKNEVCDYGRVDEIRRIGVHVISGSLKCQILIGLHDNCEQHCHLSSRTFLISFAKGNQAMQTGLHLMGCFRSIARVMDMSYEGLSNLSGGGIKLILKKAEDRIAKIGLRGPFRPRHVIDSPLVCLKYRRPFLHRPDS
jgi:hypothetical protein